MRIPLTALALALTALASGTVHTQVANVPPAEAPVSELASLVERYNLDRSALFRRYDVAYSPERYTRLTTFYKSWQQDLAAVPYDSLGVEGRIDYTLLRTRLEYELRLLGREQQWVREASSLTPFAPLITGLLEARGRLETMDAARTAATLDRLTKEIETAMKTVDAPARASGGSSVVADPVRARQINAYRAAEVLSSLRNDLAAWNRYYTGYDPMFTWWAAKPYAQADKALTGYIKLLREKVV